LAATRAGDTMFGPPWLAITTGSFTFTSAERPKLSGFNLSGWIARRMPKPVSWS
jgi:hypothetical protein